MARTKTKYTTSEVYLHLFKNVSVKLEYERDWLESGKCTDVYSQKRLVEELECTMEILRKYPNICNNFDKYN